MQRSLGAHPPEALQYTTLKSLVIIFKQFRIYFLFSREKYSVSVAALNLLKHSLRKSQTNLTVLALSLFVFWILADYSDTSFSFNDFTFFTDRFNRCSYFHWNPPFLSLDQLSTWSPSVGNIHLRLISPSWIPLWGFLSFQSKFFNKLIAVVIKLLYLSAKKKTLTEVLSEL